MGIFCLELGKNILFGIGNGAEKNILFGIGNGAEIGPIPNAKKYVFSQFQTKNSHFFFFGGGGGGFSIFILYTINTEHIVTHLQFHRITEYNNTCFFLSLFS